MLSEHNRSVMENGNEVREVNLMYSLIDAYIIAKSKLKLIITVFSIVFILGFVYILIKAPVYQTEMIVSSSVVTSERIAIIIEPLEKLVEEKNYFELSRLLKIDSSTASKIKTIEAKEIKDETITNKTPSYASEDLRQQNCLVTLKVKHNPSYFDTIQSGILSYLRNNDFVQRKSILDMNNLLNMKNRIHREIGELDSLKRTVTQQRGGVTVMDPSSINNSIAALYQSELNIDMKIKLEDNGINIIRDFARFKKPVEPKPLIVFIISFIVASLISVIWIAFEISYQNKNAQ